MPSSLKRICVVFGIVFSLFIITPSPTHAIWPIGWISETVKERIANFWADRGFTCGTDLACWTRQLGGAFVTLGHKLAFGADPIDMKVGLKTGETFAGGGMLAFVSTAGDQVYNYPPDIHLATYFHRELADNLLGIPTYATIGTEMLGDTIFDVWQRMRNIAYAFFVLVTAATAAMIVLQRQIAPRVVITVTQAIPKMLASLVIITLSYPIVALFIDVAIVWVSRVLLELGLGELHTTFGALPPGLEKTAEGLSAVGIFGEVGRRLAASFYNLFLSPAETFLTFVLLAVTLLFGCIAIIIISFAVLQLLYRYARLLILTVFAPFILLVGALPGREGVTAGWFKDLAANALVFPGILLVLYVSSAVLGGALTEQVEHITTLPGSLGELFLPTFQPLIMSIVALLILLIGSIRIPGIIEGALGRKP